MKERRSILFVCPGNTNLHVYKQLLSVRTGASTIPAHQEIREMECGLREKLEPLPREKRHPADYRDEVQYAARAG